VDNPMAAIVFASVEGGPYDGDHQVYAECPGEFANRIWGMYVITDFGTPGKAVKMHPVPRVEYIKSEETGDVEMKLVRAGQSSHKYEIVSREVDGSVVKIRARHVGVIK
jgi:hypothetical protein